MFSLPSLPGMKPTSLSFLVLSLAMAFADNGWAGMSRSSDSQTQSSKLEGLGRAVTVAELAAWDIDVRPDFKGLPGGTGTAEQGEEIWMEKCASCHGDFGDSNEIFSPLVLGNITEDDLENGNVAALLDPTRVRTTLMKVATLSTLWDYINRAMPWNAPKSLTTDQVYSVLAYLLNLGGIIEYDEEFSHKTIASVQDRMPNRNGMTREHGMWRVSDKPDVRNRRCKRKCDDEIDVISELPKFAMNAHGNLQDQMRIFGPFKGIDTAGDQRVTLVVQNEDPTVQDLLAEAACFTCHSVEKKLVGPAFRDVAVRYRSHDDPVGYLSGKIRSGSSGEWGSVMPAMSQLQASQAKQIAVWLMSLQ